jgi:uncharacterized Zn finger protein
VSTVIQGIHLICEVCAEETLIAVPAQRTRYGLVECPQCGSAYLVLVDPADAGGPKAAPAVI